LASRTKSIFHCGKGKPGAFMAASTEIIAHVDGVGPQSREPAAERQVIFLGATEPRAVRPSVSTIPYFSASTLRH
jgi:hypothetical protein